MSMKDICWAAYNSVPPGMEPGLEAVSYYDPPNMTYPFGAYICVMDIDVDTGVYKIRRFYALDDCGTRINPMIIEGQVHGGLTEAFAIAMGQEIRYDDERQCRHRLVHGFLHADRGRDAALGDRLHRHAVAASPDRRQGRRRKPECRRRAGLLQRRQRRLLVPRLAPTSRCRTTTGATGGRRRSWACSRRNCSPPPTRPCAWRSDGGRGVVRRTLLESPAIPYADPLAARG